MNWWRKLRGSVEAGPPPSAAAKAGLLESDAALPPLLERAAGLLRAGELAAAKAVLDEALGLSPRNPRALVLSARLQRRSGSHVEALRLYEEAVLVAPEPARVHMEMGETHAEHKDLPAALDALNLAVTLDATLCEAWMRLGDVYQRLDRHEEGLEAYQHARDTATQVLAADAWFQYGQALHLLKRHADAVSAYEESLQRDGDSLDTLMAIGHAELLQEHDEAALRHYERALALTDRPTPSLQIHLATAYQYCGRWADAQKRYEASLAANPNDHLTRWYLAQSDLALCNWTRGWDGYRTRFAAGASPYRPLPFKPWSGAAVPGDTLLILADQGLGDEIMFASCIPDAMAHAGHCVVECEPRLEALFRRSFPGATILSSNRKLDGKWLTGVPAPQWQIFGGDLPALYRRSDADFPQRPGYLKADPERVAYWRTRLDADLGPGVKVGVSWRGGTQYTRTRSRSLQPQDWAPILSNSGCRFVNLQYGKYEAELAQLNARMGQVVHDFPEALADYDETAALVSALDLVATVCTAIVHLAGALGRPAWVLVPFSPGWRYTVERDVMPWYPSTRLFRQSGIGDWAPACQALSHELTKRVT